MKIVDRDIKSIVPYENNTKFHDQTQIDNVARSIERYGFVQPIVIDKNGVIVIGHCRYAAAKQLQLNMVPCVSVDTLTEEQVNALRIVDNKTNESDWDMTTLEQELAKIADETSYFDFDFDFGDDMKNEQEPDDSGIDPDDFDDDKFAHECPRCGFKWDD